MTDEARSPCHPCRDSFDHLCDRWRRSLDGVYPRIRTDLPETANIANRHDSAGVGPWLAQSHRAEEVAADALDASLDSTAADVDQQYCSGAFAHDDHRIR